MTSILRRIAPSVLGSILFMAGAPASIAQPIAADRTAPADLAGGTYADLAGLADSAPVVVHARIRKLARLADERAPGLKEGTARFYVEAETQALLTGRAPIGQSFAYLVDVPLDFRGKAPIRKKDEVLLFARMVPGRPGELQLVRPGAQIPWNEQADTRVRAIIRELVAADAPARVTGVRELIHVPGTLAGEGETQIFLTTEGGAPASITVRHQPNRKPEWGVSFSELVANVGNPPARDTLEWYRLACFLPRNPPASANMSEGYEAGRRADDDYRLVLASLGPCRRTM